MARMKIPRRFIMVPPQAGTVAVRSGRTGRFQGRRRTSGKGDRTSMQVFRRDVDIDHDGDIDYHGGTSVGRTTKVRANSRTKGFQRSLR